MLYRCVSRNALLRMLVWGHRRECAALTARPKAMAEELRCKSGAA